MSNVTTLINSTMVSLVAFVAIPILNAHGFELWVLAATMTAAFAIPFSFPGYWRTMGLYRFLTKEQYEIARRAIIFGNVLMVTVVVLAWGLAGVPPLHGLLILGIALAFTLPPAMLVIHYNRP